MSSAEEINAAVAARFVDEYWGKLNPDVVDELCADNIYQWYPLLGDANEGRDAVKKSIIGFRTVCQPFSRLGLDRSSC
jgi:hypothetical protein